MKTFFLKLTAVLLLVACLLSGCTPVDLDDLMGGPGSEIVAFGDMEYVRPDNIDLESRYQRVTRVLSGGDAVEEVMEAVFAFYEDYHTFYTAYALANIYYNKDLTDAYWEEEYNYCMESSTQVDAILDQLLYDLAASDLKEELEAEEYFGPNFFDDYQGESIWDDTFTALSEKEAKLQSKYYELTEKAQTMDSYSNAFFTTVGREMAELFVELVQVRQEMAAYAGYADYPSFAYDFYYYRDFTPVQATGYMAKIAQELVPLYRNLDHYTYWQIAGKGCTEKQTLQYVQSCAEAMGGVVQEAFQVMTGADLYDISVGANKFNASFEIYISNYNAPYVFLNPAGRVSDKLTFAHEFGHFCNDYASWGGMSSIDVAEFFSQGMEYLSLCYVPTKDMDTMKMMDCLSLYVEQSAYASFEHQVYSLKGEALTVENVYALYEKVGKTYGFDSWGWDSRDFVLIPHFYTSPMYIISYVVSNDAALQLYQMEKANQGAGLAVFSENLTTTQGDFLAFVESAGLTSPFAPGRMETVRQTLEGVLK
jgi:hypothetical protein